MSIDAFKNTTFNNIVIMPTILLSSEGKAEFSIISGTVRVLAGGPIYDNNVPRYVRQCIGMIPIVLDENGKTEIPDNTLDEGVWCGHVHGHFGHMIADFAMRIAVSAAKHPDKALLFGVQRNADIKAVPEFFWGILHAFGAKKENVRFINQPTLVKELVVYAQAERRYNGNPSRSYLELLNLLHPPIKKCYRAIYFSRSNYLKGGIAGERYLEEVMRDIGVLVVRPEEYSLAEQIKFCQQAEKLIFAEGSAVHLLQFLGTGIGDVIILNRRTSIIYFNFFCRSSILPRANSLKYINSITAIIYSKPEIKLHNGLTILKTDKRFFMTFKKSGFDIESVWNSQKYEESRNQAIMKWFEILHINIWGNERFHKKIKILRELFPEINNAVTNKQLIYDRWQNLKKLGLFDEIYYLTQNPDVKNAGVNSLDHYIKYGWKESRNPSVYFDTRFYMNQFPDGYNDSLDPLSHYLDKGWKDYLNPNPQFDVKAYLNRYQEVKVKNLEPLQHYIEHGQFLGYITSA